MGAKSARPCLLIKMLRYLEEGAGASLDKALIKIKQQHPRYE
jgi:hypothetical protein